MLRTHTYIPANFKDKWATPLRLNLQMLYLILGNFCNAWNDFRQGTHTLTYILFTIIIVLFFFLPRSQVIQKIIYLYILPCYEPLHFSETYGLLTYGLCFKLLIVLKFEKQKGYKSQHIWQNCMQF